MPTPGDETKLATSGSNRGIEFIATLREDCIAVSLPTDLSIDQTSLQINFTGCLSLLSLLFSFLP